jgi:RNA polymerase sigma-32 factor
MDFFGPCRIGTNLNDKKVFTQFRRLRAMIEARTGEPLDDAGREEIAETIGVSVEIVKRMEPRILRSDVSLDAPISSEGEEGESGSRMEMLIDEGPDPEELTMSRMDRKKVGGILAELIQELPDRERSIIHHRLLSGERMQLHELGEILGVTKERVRQIERKALKQLRQSLEERGFSAGDFIDGR